MNSSTLAWQHFQPVRLVFGVGCVSQLSCVVPSSGRLLVVTTAGFVKRDQVATSLGALMERSHLFAEVRPNPDLTHLDAALLALRSQGPFSGIVALGGGSAIDSAKALAAGLAAPVGWTLREHLLGALPFPQDLGLLPSLIALPTTAGTGSEVTSFATIWDHQTGAKYSLVHPRLHPTVALLDPALTLSLPPDVTLHTGLDALAQGLESVWNRHSTPVSAAWAMAAVEKAWRALPLLMEDLSDLSLRSQMMEASLLAGLAISQTRTALAHAISYPITADFGVPHGLACALTLSALWQHGLSQDDGRLAALAQRLGYSTAHAAGDALAAWLQKLGVPAMIADYGVTLETLLPLLPRMFTPGRADNQWPSLAPEKLPQLLAASFPLAQRS